jgi:dihydrolipoamide dehydrogenase
MNANYDVVIVGAGSAGLAALREVRKRTPNFLLVNDGAWGTTCARVGCMPSKVLIEAANAYHRRHAFEEFGIRGAGSLSVDLPAVLRRVRRLRDGFVKGTLQATDNLGERAVAGRARLLGPGRLEVNGREISARAIVLATGSSPVVPPAWQALGERLLTTDTLFERRPCRRASRSSASAPSASRWRRRWHGWASTSAAFGRGHIGGLSDAKVSAAATALLGGEFALHLGAEAEVAAADGAIRVRAGDAEATVDAVLAALGRRPNLAGLGLETLGIALDPRGMPPVDPNTQQVADLPLFLAGDANGERALLHEAADEGHIAGLNAVRLAAGEKPACYARRTPLAIVFSEPNIAVAGRRRADLAAGSVHRGRYRFRAPGPRPRRPAQPRPDAPLRRTGYRQAARRRDVRAGWASTWRTYWRWRSTAA